MSRRYYSNNGLKALWTGLVTLAVIALLFITIGVVALRIGNSLPEGVDIILIVPKTPQFDVGDEKGSWETNTQVDIFSSSYQNGENVTTVLSQTGEDIIAPGTVSTYSFCMYNSGNMAMAYDLDFSFVLKINNVTANAEAFPLAIRMTRTDGAYVVGGSDKWVNLTAGVIDTYKGIVGASSYEQFNLEIMWAFEGNDELDTALGNAAAKAPVSLTFQIHSYAETSENSTAQGGVVVNEGVNDGYEYGGTIRWELFLPVLVLLCALGMYVVIWRL